MNDTYLSTFITGFGDVVKNNLSKHLKISKINLLLDGLIVYQTSVDIGQLRKINYLNNTFVVLKKFSKSKEITINSMLRNILSDESIFKIVLKHVNKRSSFRIIVSKENQLVSIDRRLLKNIEDKLSRNRNLHPNRLKPDIEFWLLLRSEGVAFFCMRLTKKPNQEKYLEKGELRPELASLLCLISEPQNNDIFMDPFCGYGSIPIQRLFIPSVKYQEIMAFDKDPELIARLKLKIKQLQKKKTVKRFTIKNFNVLDLQFLPDSLVTKIVTDPPWGLRASNIKDIERFYGKMMDEFYRVLGQGGVLVILAKKEVFDKILGKYSGRFKLFKEYTTLVSGQKASVYKIRIIK